MKKTILFSSALVALAMLASCQKEQPIETPATATGVTEFTATIGQPTKTAIDGDGKVTWTAGDEITITDAASKSAVYVATSSGESTTFTLMQGQTAVGSGPYKATYGDITKQVYDANGANCPLTAAETSTTNLHFSSPYAVLKITAQSSNAEVIKTVAVTYGNNSYYLDCSEKNVALTSTGVDFYVAVEPAKSAVALSVAFYTAEKMAKKTRNESISLNAKDLLSVKFDLSSSTWITPTKTETFKAVYKGDDGSLTFYYDESLHIGDGVLYDNLPAAATGNTSWGYDGVRKEIKKVVITESVKDYSGLKSTAWMFQNMTIASSISGAENLDVSEVTNMTAMFWNFGSDESSTLESAPEVDNWNTGKVENMQNMFMNYGAGPKDFNDVPNVSNWDTRKVTNMQGMFSGFANNSKKLTKVPPVDGNNWKTDEVKNMSKMFQAYGSSSEDLNAVPNVSGWDTQNVTTLADMFNGYGKSSSKLTAVPTVSNWKTGAVTTMLNLFQNYGNGSVTFELDLSGWDLSGISGNNGNNVFDCIADGFYVKIPTKTTGNDNTNTDTTWYYGTGNNFITPAYTSRDKSERHKFNKTKPAN